MRLRKFLWLSSISAIPRSAIAAVEAPPTSMQEVTLIAVVVTGVIAAAALAAYVLLRIHRDKQRAKSHYTSVAKQFETEAQQSQSELAKVEQENGKIKQYQQQLESRAQVKEREAQEAKMLNPAFKRLVYNIAVVGVSTSGKTALISKLVDPCFMNIQGMTSTTVEQQDRTVTVSLNVKKHLRTEHVLRFYEWGGEYLVKAQSDMLTMCRPDFRIDENGLVRHAGIQALILVVDLAQPRQDPDVANPDKHEFSKDRISRQIHEYFSFNSIKFLLNERILPYLQLVILFVNKVDRLSSNQHAEMEAMAKDCYKDLIMGLRNSASKVEVIVGSAYTEFGLHRLFSVLATSVLPREAWDGSLRPRESEAAKSGAGFKVHSPVPTEQADNVPSAAHSAMLQG